MLLEVLSYSITKPEKWLVHPEKTYEPRRQKTGLRGFQPGPTQTRLYSHRRWLETWNFGFRKQRDCTVQVAKTKALISFAVTAKLICVFVFAYAKIRFSHVAAHIKPAWIYTRLKICAVRWNSLVKKAFWHRAVPWTRPWSTWPELDCLTIKSVGFNNC